MAALADLQRTARRVAALMLIDERVAPVFDRLIEEIEAAKKGGPKDRARRFLESANA